MAVSRGGGGGIAGQGELMECSVCLSLCAVFSIRMRKVAPREGLHRHTHSSMCALARTHARTHTHAQNKEEPLGKRQSSPPAAASMVKRGKP
jgi:hypothetical protein